MATIKGKWKWANDLLEPAGFRRRNCKLQY